MSSEPVLLVGIAGGSGSGKTSLARELCRELPGGTALRLEHDSYYHDLAHLPSSERTQVNFDHPRSLDNDLLADHLEALQAGRSIPGLSYDFSTHTRRRVTQVVEARPVVIVEGILLFSVPRLLSAFDLRVFVDCPSDLRFIRRLKRDISERGRDVPGVCEQYLGTVRPMHEEFVEPGQAEAHVVVSGLARLQDSVRDVRTAIGERTQVPRSLCRSDSSQ